ncbi:hypothetical protein Trydic_g6215 [Trypoxylus dichotomus]
MGDRDDQATFVELNRRRQQEEEEDEEDSKPKQNWCVRFLQSRRTRLLAAVFLFALVVPILLYFFLFWRPNMHAEEDRHTCAISTEFRILCGDGNFTEADCLSRSCCFDFTDFYCYHFVPSKYRYNRGNGHIFTSHLRDDVFGNVQKNLNYTIQHMTANKVKIIIHQATYETNTLTDDAYYEVRPYGGKLGFDIVRYGTDDVILTTGLGPLMMSENYFEISFYMGDTLFGLDELYFDSNETYRKVIYNNRNDHTTIPAFMAYNGTYAGIYFDIAGPVELSVLPSRLISVRSLGITEMSFTLVSGPTPKDVQQQLYQFYLPKRWWLQPHICRDGPTDIYSLIEEYISFNENNTDVRYATDCLHQNLYYLLYSINETERASLATVLDRLNEKSTFVMTLYPQVLNGTDVYDSALNSNLLYTLGNETYHSVHLDQQVAYVDYGAQGVYSWFGMVRDMFSSFEIGGYSLKDNWPEDGAFIMEKIEELPYLNGTFLNPMSNTIPWNATTPSSQRHIGIHNSYVRGQVDLLRQAFANPFILTSAYTTDMGDAIAQVQNMNTSWVNLRKTIKMALSHGLFASPFISIPVCGSTSEYAPDYQFILCARWYITAATFPIFSVSSDNPRRDQTALPSGHNRKIALDALNIRKMLTPYYYTVLSRQEPLVRPMFYDFHDDNYTWALDAQYMLGDALLVAQPLLRDMYLITVYLPVKAGGFYEFFGGEYIGELGNVTLSVLVETDWLVFMQEGKIVPLQNEHDNYTLAIALSQDEQTANGTLFFNNVLMQMTADDETLRLSHLTAVREDLNCSDGVAAVDLPTIISDARIYGLYGSTDVFTISTFEPVNLCETEGDEWETNYFEPITSV